ncbi:hypothetical protein ACWEKT_16335 [Nocardia takedensis]
MSGSVIDADTLVALREILDDPSLPVGTTAEGPEGVRVARLREALDHLVTVRAGAAVLGDPDAGAHLVHALEALDVELAAVLERHVTAVRALSALEPGRARNAVLGDVGRGDLIAFAEVRAWRWDGDHAPDAAHPLRQAHGALVVEDYPGLYDTVLAWHSDTGGLVAVSTHRQGLAWTPVDGGADWALALDAVTFHADDLIPLDRDPRA